MHEAAFSSNRTSLLRRDQWIVGVLLLLLMLAGGALRFVGINWDDYTFLHPDERFLMQVTTTMGGPHTYVMSDPAGLTVEQRAIRARCLDRYPDTAGSGGYFDAECSPYNPHNSGWATFVYGTLPVFSFKGMSEIFAAVTGDLGWTGFVQLFVAARTVSAISEMLIILVIFSAGLRAHDKWVGLLAATLYTFTAFSIQQAHFGTADSMANLFSALSILFAICIQRDGKLRDYVFFGAAFGAALASRINLLPLVGLLIGVAVLRALPALARGVERGERDATLTQIGVGLVMAAMTTLVIFRLFNPYAFLGPGVFGLVPNPAWLEDIGLSRYFVSGAYEAPPNWQWVSRPRYLFALWNMIAWGMGIALGITGWVAVTAALWRILRGRAEALRNAVPVAWVIGYFASVGGLWVMTMRYYLPLYPALALLAAWAILSLIRARRAPQATPRPARPDLRRAFGWTLLVVVTGFTVAWGLGYAQNYTRLMTRVEASYWFWESVPGDFAMRVENAPTGTPLINIALSNSAYVGENYNLPGQATRFPEVGSTLFFDFVAPASGFISRIHAPHLGDMTDTADPERLRFSIQRYDTGFEVGAAWLEADFTRDNHPLGDAYDIPFETPMEVEEGVQYRFVVSLEQGQDVITGGSVVTWEGDWDDPMPQKTCTPSDGLTLADNPPPGRFSPAECAGRDVYWALLSGGYKLQITNNDSQANRDRMMTLLDDSDYIIIGSNRFYDSMARNPMRWPFANRYYEALFNGELGFELAAVFDRGFQLGPLTIPTNNLPIWDTPAWMNELEAEEAFHVYDHPAVLIFRKSETYSSEVMRAVLEEVPMATSIAARPLANCPDNPSQYYCDATLIDTDLLVSTDAARVPTYLQMPQEDRPLQEAGATWSDRFDSSAPINTQQGFTLVVWWLAIIGFGWAAFPLLYTVLPVLHDRGYAMSKITGLVLTTWLAWTVASVHIPAWNAPGILAALLAVIALSVAVVWKQRGAFVRFIGERWRTLFLIELITLAAFLFFIGVRMSNPDLWHYAFGGEKPMDFAYFNGVLRSSVFPAIDPWYSGGYINYYYFGFVLVGTPTLLLGVIPQIAYNLAIPTIFALTGIGAFTVAFNVIAALQERRATPNGQTPRRANPWLAGVAALLLAVLLGNLDTPRTFLTGVMQLGGYQQQGALVDFLIDEAQAANPDAPIDYAAIERQAINPTIFDRLRYDLTDAGNTVSAFVTGISRWLSGAPLPIAPHRWYWGPTRIFNENPADLGIVEMPYFTFLYGDLHAHMIAMPMQLLVVGLLLHEVLAARRGRRTWPQIALAVGLTGVTVGLLNATNTWDWITYLILGVVALTFAWWVSWRGQLSRSSILGFVGTVGLFMVAQYTAALPYTTWYASAYTSVVLWQGAKSSLWGYFSVHGLFLLLMISLLTWETGRWFRSVRVRDLVPIAPFVIAGALLSVTLLLVTVIAALAGYPVALIVVPLILWIALVFFRPGQARAMQFLLALMGLGLALTLGVEIVVLGGDIGRQNTMFKFYMQVWLLFSVVGGAALALLWNHRPQWNIGLRYAWTGALGLLVVIAALFPLMATQGRASDRFSQEVPLTLDGLAYMNYTTYSENAEEIALSGDYAMIRWLQENIVGLPTIMEAQSEPNLYKWGSRISINTGLPSVVGWDWHQTQQRGLFSMAAFVRQRGSNVNAFYNTLSIPTAQRILDFYDVDLIIVGALERAYYSRDSLAKFAAMEREGLLEAIYRQGEDVIYRVVRGSDTVALVQR